MNTMNLQGPVTGADVLPPMVPRKSKPARLEAAGKQESRAAAIPSVIRSTKSQERFKMLNRFIDDIMGSLSPSQVKVWLCLYRDSRDGVAKSAQDYIAKRCGLKRPTVSTTITELEQLGLVETIHQGGVNRGFSWYRVGICRRG
jgi:hypothetical protein